METKINKNFPLFAIQTKKWPIENKIGEVAC